MLCYNDAGFTIACYSTEENRVTLVEEEEPLIDQKAYEQITHFLQNRSGATHPLSSDTQQEGSLLGAFGSWLGLSPPTSPAPPDDEPELKETDTLDESKCIEAILACDPDTWAALCDHLTGMAHVHPLVQLPWHHHKAFVFPKDLDIVCWVLQQLQRDRELIGPETRRESQNDWRTRHAAIGWQAILERHTACAQAYFSWMPDPVHTRYDNRQQTQCLSPVFPTEHGHQISLNILHEGKTHIDRDLLNVMIDKGLEYQVFTPISHPTTREAQTIWITVLQEEKQLCHVLELWHQHAVARNASTVVPQCLYAMAQCERAQTPEQPIDMIRVAETLQLPLDNALDEKSSPCNSDWINQNGRIMPWLYSRSSHLNALLEWLGDRTPNERNALLASAQALREQASPPPHLDEYLLIVMLHLEDLDTRAIADCLRHHLQALTRSLAADVQSRPLDATCGCWRTIHDLVPTQDLWDEVYAQVPSDTLHDFINAWRQHASGANFYLPCGPAIQAHLIPILATWDQEDSPTGMPGTLQQYTFDLHTAPLRQREDWHAAHWLYVQAKLPLPQLGLEDKPDCHRAEHLARTLLLQPDTPHQLRRHGLYHVWEQATLHSQPDVTAFCYHQLWMRHGCAIGAGILLGAALSFAAISGLASALWTSWTLAQVCGTGALTAGIASLSVLLFGFKHRTTHRIRALIRHMLILGLAAAVGVTLGYGVCALLPAIGPAGIQLAAAAVGALGALELTSLVAPSPSRPRP